MALERPRMVYRHSSPRSSRRRRRVVIVVVILPEAVARRTASTIAIDHPLRHNVSRQVYFRKYWANGRGNGSNSTRRDGDHSLSP